MSGSFYIEGEGEYHSLDDCDDNGCGQNERDDDDLFHGKPPELADVTAPRIPVHPVTRSDFDLVINEATKWKTAQAREIAGKHINLQLHQCPHLPPVDVWHISHRIRHELLGEPSNMERLLGKDKPEDFLGPYNLPQAEIPFIDEAGVLTSRRAYQEQNSRTLQLMLERMKKATREERNRMNNDYRINYDNYTTHQENTVNPTSITVVRIKAGYVGQVIDNTTSNVLWESKPYTGKDKGRASDKAHNAAAKRRAKATADLYR